MGELVYSVAHHYCSQFRILANITIHQSRRREDSGYLRNSLRTGDDGR
jgi:hypothetical protein